MDLKGQVKISSRNQTYFGKFSKIEKIIHIFTEVTSQSIQINRIYNYELIQEASLRKNIRAIPKILLLNKNLQIRIYKFIIFHI